MPDLDLMPSGRTMQAAPRPPAGLGEVLIRAGRRRRRQQAGLLATGAAACAAVLAITLTGGSAVDSLRETPATQNGHGVLPTDTTQATGAEVPGSARGAGSAGSAQEPGAQGTAGQQPAAQYGQRDPVAATQPQQQASGGEVGPPHTMTSYDAARGCAGTGSNAAEGWCGYYDGAKSGAPGKRVELAETLCRLPNRGTGTLLSDTGQQAEFAVISQDAYTKWLWSKGHRFSKRGTRIAVPEGSCVRWHVSWNVVDNDGNPLPPGAYNLSAKPWTYPSATAAPASVWADANIVTFTVT